MERDPFTYREHEPSHDLRPFVECFWSRQSRPSGDVRVLPDGCIDLLFDLSRPGSGGPYLIGAMTRPFVVTEDGSSRWLGVRFRPGGAFPFLRFRLSQVTDSRAHLVELWPEADGWSTRLAAAKTLGARVSALEAGLRKRLALLGSPRPDPRVRHAVARTIAAGGGVSTVELSRELGLSRQHITRLLDQHLGLGTKRFLRIMRLQRAVRLLETEPRDGSIEGASLAVRLGYFDQSHFISDFKALTGLTPTEHHRTRFR